MIADVSKAPMISIVDDDPSVRQAIDGLLRSLDYRVATFVSAEDFLRSSHMNETSCLICDIHMPGMGGVDLQRALIAQGNRTPMIFITAFPEERIRRYVMGAGAIDYLDKPLDEERLIERLQTALVDTRSAA